MTGETFEVNLKIHDAWRTQNDYYRLVNLGAGPDQLQVENEDGTWRAESTQYVHGVRCARIREQAKRASKVHTAYEERGYTGMAAQRLIAGERMDACPSVNPETGSACIMAKRHFGPHCTGSPYPHKMKERWVTKCEDGKCDYHETFVRNPGHEECIHCGHVRKMETEQTCANCNRMDGKCAPVTPRNDCKDWSPKEDKDETEQKTET
jgi:hypothetical protein